MFYVASRQQSNYASSLVNLLSTIDECRRVPRTYVSDGMHRPSHAQVGIYAGKYIKWIAFSFQSVRTALVCENVYNILTVVETFKSSLCFVFVCDEYSFVVSFVLFPLTKLILEIQSYFWRVLNEYLFFLHILKSAYCQLTFAVHRFCQVSLMFLNLYLLRQCCELVTLGVDCRRRSKVRHHSVLTDNISNGRRL